MRIKTCNTAMLRLFMEADSLASSTIYASLPAAGGEHALVERWEEGGVIRCDAIIHARGPILTTTQTFAVRLRVPAERFDSLPNWRE